MQEEFLGYHSEWNMGSPGGWDYQKMAQEVAKIGWERIRKKANIKIDLDFNHPLLNPVPGFAETLLRSHKSNFPNEDPVIALVAERETLDKVGENIRFVKYLNGLPGVKAVLTDPAGLRLEKGRIYAGEDRITSIFMDFNNNVIVKLRKEYNLDALLSAIRLGIVTNPRGTEPIGAKGVFEAVTSECRDTLSMSTVKRTPWTRQFYPRKTMGPDKREIEDLVEWARDNWRNIILKPAHGHSGKGIIIGHKEGGIEAAIKHALDRGDYIIQTLIPPKFWSEDFPWMDKKRRRLFIKRWQTDFRCFITDKGLIGFVTRFGGIPTNVGSGGGIQSTAVLCSRIRVREAIELINRAILKLGYAFISKLQDELDAISVEMGNVYLLGPIKCTLRPRIITRAHIEQLNEYAVNLWKDALALEEMWLQGRLKRYVQINAEEESIARMAPWAGRPALIASDGLFDFKEGT